MTAQVQSLLKIIIAVPVTFITALFYWRALRKKLTFPAFTAVFVGCMLPLEIAHQLLPVVLHLSNTSVLSVVFHVLEALLSILLLIRLSALKRPQNAVLLFCAGRLIRVFSLLASAACISLFTKLTIPEYAAAVAGSLRFSLLTNVFNVALLFLASEWIERLFSSGGFSSERMNAFVPIACGQVVTLFVIGAMLDHHRPENILPLYVGLIAVYAVSDYVLLHAFKDLSENTLLKARLADFEKERTIEREYYLAAADQLRLTQRMRHDFKNALITVDALLDKGETQRAKDFADSYRSSIGGHVWVMFTGNEIIDAVINKKATEAAIDGIQLDAQLLLPEPFPLREFDSMSLFSNLIDNALEHIRMLPAGFDRTLAISSAIRADFFLLRVSNACQTKQLEDAALPLTTKADASNHGHGLGIVKEIAERYDGSLSLSIQNSRFVAMVTINLAMPPTQ